MEQVEVEYVPEKAELEAGMDEEFRRVFEIFSFQDSAVAEVWSNYLIICFDFFILVFPLKIQLCDALYVLFIQEDNKDESAQNAASNKKSDSDSEEEEQNNQLKDKGVSNKKKKVLMTVNDFSMIIYFVIYLFSVDFSFIFQLQRRMKIAELKQISSRPDVVEVLIFSSVMLNLLALCFFNSLFNFH